MKFLARFSLFWLVVILLFETCHISCKPMIQLQEDKPHKKQQHSASGIVLPSLVPSFNYFPDTRLQHIQSNEFAEDQIHKFQDIIKKSIEKSQQERESAALAKKAAPKLVLFIFGCVLLLIKTCICLLCRCKKKN